MDPQEQPIIKARCSEAQLRASKAYYDRNKAAIMAKALERNNHYYATNETFRGKCKEASKNNVQKQKEKIKQMKEFIAKITEIQIPNL